MWGLDYSTLKVGDEVSVARSGSWDTRSEGVYKVVKVNKLKLIVQRVGDGYERSFSVKRRCESGASDRYRSAFLETVADKEQREARQKRERDVKNAWAAVEQAGRGRNVDSLREALHELAKLVDKPLM